MAGKMKSRVAFNITSGASTKKWIMHLKPDEEPAVFQVEVNDTLDVKPNVTLICSDATLISLSNGSLSPEYAYMRGLLQVKGQMGVALKVKLLLNDVGGAL